MAAGEIFRCEDDDDLYMVVYLQFCDRFPKDRERWFLRHVVSPLEAYRVTTQGTTIYIFTDMKASILTIYTCKERIFRLVN
jgi:hypothetical protein